MKQVFPHRFSAALGLKVLRLAEAQLREQHPALGLTTIWEEQKSRVGFGFTALTTRFAGVITSKDRGLHLEMDVPTIFKAWIPLAKQVIEREVGKWIARVEKGELG
ncbi:MAG: hypothetical protein WC683_02540 [bacterium]